MVPTDDFNVPHTVFPFPLQEIDLLEKFLLVELELTHSERLDRVEEGGGAGEDDDSWMSVGRDESGPRTDDLTSEANQAERGMYRIQLMK